jgi:hypothetical protein
MAPAAPNQITTRACMHTCRYAECRGAMNGLDSGKYSHPSLVFVPKENQNAPP